MRRLEEYISAGGKRLRCGYTTGTCAAAATRAAAELLLADKLVASVSVHTPSGIEVLVDVEEAQSGSGWARCAVCKDAGDDPDVTDGVLVMETGQGYCVAAINDMGELSATELLAHNPGLRGISEQQACQQQAQRHSMFFERAARLGIEGGISVLGTSGIVRPMSEEALVASIRLELKVLRATGATDVLVVPGNYGRDYAAGVLGLSVDHAVTCSNYLGEAIDEAGLLGFESMLVVGHVGKLVKVAAGVMNTHSRVADCRVEVLAAHAALAGAGREVVREVMDAATTDAVVDILQANGLLDLTMDTLVTRMGEHLNQRGADRLQVEAVMFSQRHGLLGMTAGAKELLARHVRREAEDA